jgi:hypothetical protein
MTEWKFYIDDVEYDEPDNWDDVLLMLHRDEAYHGVFSEASISSLAFTEDAALYIMDKEEQEGLLALITFRAEYRCNDDEYEMLLTGALNLGKMERYCGAGCRVVLPIEQANCTMLVRNRLDTKVDLDSLLAFDKVTPLEAYEWAGFTLDMPAKAIPVGAVGNVEEAGDRVTWENFPFALFGIYSYIRPTYGKQANASINQTQLVPTVFAADSTGAIDTAVSPVVLINETINCFGGSFTYAFRFKGDIVNLGDANTIRIIIVKGLLPDNENPLNEPYDNPDNPTFVPLHNEVIGGTLEGDSNPVTKSFDYSYSGTTTLGPGEGVWGYMYFAQSTRLNDASQYVNFDPETSVSITAVRECPVTDAKAYMINEALSRVTEAITNACVRVRSDYYGRTDSRPYAAEVDGCGSLRAINNGLQLRRADVRDPQSDDFAEAKMFVSLKDLLEGLNPIDNIGFGIEADPDRPGFDQLRVEPIEYFYREEEVLSLPLVNDVKVVTVEQECWANIKIGYQKWEVEAVNGLDEVNANREFRTALTTVNHTISLLSKFVAGSYAIEVTRQQSYAESGAADTTYDNEAFVYCLIRALYGFDIEQGGVAGATGVYSPSTLYNWRIRPFYNLMRWFKSIANVYPHLGDTAKKLFFTAGTANYRAAGELSDLWCKLEDGVKAENQDLGVDDFAASDYIPLWRPKTIQFKCDLSIADYKLLRDSPHGYISVQCGTGEWLKGFINTVQFNPKLGEADFNLQLKWLV